MTPPLRNWIATILGWNKKLIKNCALPAAKRRRTPKREPISFPVYHPFSRNSWRRRIPATRKICPISRILWMLPYFTTRFGTIPKKAFASNHLILIVQLRFVKLILEKNHLRTAEFTKRAIQPQRDWKMRDFGSSWDLLRKIKPTILYK